MSKPKISRERWALAAAEFESGEKTGREIAAELGVSIGSFNWNMLREGASPPNARVLPARAPGPAVVKRNGHIVRHFTEEEDALMLALSIEGKTTSEIARAIGRRWNSTRGRLMTLARHDDRKEAAA